MWEEILTNYLIPALVTILSSIFVWLGTKIKNLIEEKIKNEEIKNIIDDVVRYTEQKSKDLTSSEKFDMALSKASEWLAEKKINVSETQLEILIESSVNSFNEGLKGSK